MLDPQEVATYITDALNEKSKSNPAENGWFPTFSLIAEVSEGHEKATVEGALVTINEDILPVLNGFKQVLYTYRAQFFFSSLTNDEYIENKQIIESVIVDNQCKELEFSTGKGIITFNGGTPGKVFSASSYGSGVQYEFTVSVAYTENAVSSGQKHWLLDGVEIPFLSESVTVETEGAPRKIFSEVYSKALITGKTKYYTFRIPYESGTYKNIQHEIMNSATIGVVHTLSYYDGEAFKQDAPFTAKVSIHRTASSSSTRPNGSVYEVTFSDVYDKDKNTLKYSIALIDFPFDMNGEDTRYFKSTKEQFDYFEAKAEDSSAPFVEIMAPNLDNLVITQQVYYNPSASAITQFDYASKNYAIVKVEDTSVTPTETRHYYYFIEKATIGAGGYVLCDLRLDTVQTYFFRPDITFSDCLIERAHLDRFEKIAGDPTHVRFVSDPASKIFNSEDGLNFPKRLVKREKLQLAFTGNEAVDNWLNENVAYWVYVFIDPNHQFKIVNIGNSSQWSTTPKMSSINGAIRYPKSMNGATSCYSYPIYKHDDKKIKFKDQLGNLQVLSKEGRYYFEDENPQTITDEEQKTTVNVTYYYSINVSILPPFDNMQNATFKIENNNLIIDVEQADKSFGLGVFGDNNYMMLPKAEHALMFGSNQTKPKITSQDVYLTENDLILKTEIKNDVAPQLKFNPKLNGQSFKELVITASSGDTFAYDIQKLVESDVVFEYTEPIAPEITKYYLRVAGGTGLYTEGTENNYTGLVGSTDNGLAFVNDQYAAFIANNKNFYLQSNLKIGASLVGGLIGAGAQAANATISVAQLNALQATSGYVGAMMGVGSSLFQAGMSAIDRSLTIDNMKNAPSQLKNANGNVIFNMMSMLTGNDDTDLYSDLGVYVEEYSALDGDLKTANDFMNLYGFSFNSVENVKDYANKRKYHNYVKAQLQSINGNLNNVARNDLRQRFANGVRFWNGDEVQYIKENYEIWLDQSEPVEEIHFNVDRQSYTAKKGSIWTKFVNSNYNDGEFSIDQNYVLKNGLIVDYELEGNNVSPSNLIVDRGIYLAVRDGSEDPPI